MRRIFWGFLQKLGPHRSLTLPFEPFRFWLRIRGDIHNGKTTPRLWESATLRLGKSGSQGVDDSPSRGVDDSPSGGVDDSPSRGVDESGSRLLNV